MKVFLFRAQQREVATPCYNALALRTHRARYHAQKMLRYSQAVEVGEKQGERKCGHHQHHYHGHCCVSERSKDGGTNMVEAARRSECTLISHPTSSDRRACATLMVAEVYWDFWPTK